MTLVPTFLALLQPLCPVMTGPSFASLITIITGWIFARRRTITGALVAGDAVGTKHHSSYHRLFATARWSLDEMGLAVFGVILPWITDAIVGLTLDDTLSLKRGAKMFGAGMHHDAKASTRKVKVVRWGLSWVILCVAVRLPFRPDKVFSLPILFRLYLNKNGARRWRRVHRTRPQLAVELLRVLCRRFPNRKFHVTTDSTYGGESVMGNLPDNCDMTSRLDLDARLHAVLPSGRSASRGRPRKRGDRLPSPRQMLQQRGKRLTLNIYGRKDRVRVVTAEACLYKVPNRLVKVVAVEPLVGGRPVQAFFSTEVTDDAVTVLTRYGGRWSVEETFQAAKTHLGFEQPQGWTRLAVLRTAPMIMLLYGLVVLWFAKHGHVLFRLRVLPWYTSKRYPSFADMLATLKLECLRQRISELVPDSDLSRKVQDAVATPLVVSA